jgi:hypothetical protein
MLQAVVDSIFAALKSKFGGYDIVARDLSYFQAIVDSALPTVLNLLSNANLPPLGSAWTAKDVQVVVDAVFAVLEASAAGYSLPLHFLNYLADWVIPFVLPKIQAIV